MRNAEWENDKHLTFNMCICINISLHTYCHYNNSLISIVNYPCLFVYVMFIMKKIYVAAAAEHRCTHDGKHHYFLASAIYVWLNSNTIITRPLLETTMCSWG